MARRSPSDAVVQDVVRLALRQRKHRGMGIVIGLLVLAGSAVWSHYRTKPDPAKWDGQAGVVCRRVIDGDTIIIDGPGMQNEHLRFRGIDAPEVSHDANTPSAHFGPEARRFLAERIEGKPITLKFDGTERRDRYDRVLGFVYVGDDCVNLELVEKGYAYVNRQFKTVLQANLDTAETQARTRKIGLWKDLRPQDMPEWRQKWLAKQQSRPNE